MTSRSLRSDGGIGDLLDGNRRAHSRRADPQQKNSIRGARLRAIRADFGVYVPDVKPRRPEDLRTGIWVRGRAPRDGRVDRSTARASADV
jgi:hypothetical protein